MVKIATLSTAILTAAMLLAQGGMMPGPGVKKYAAAANNVALVGSNKGGAGGSQATTVAYSFSGASVTNGNTVLCGVAVFSFGGGPFTSGMLTKTAGTSTVGTIALDQAANDATHSSTALYRVPVTGTGTITLTFNGGGGSFFMLMGCAEFSGVNATPLSTTSTATSTGTTHTTGSVVTTDVGVMMYVASEVAAGDFTRTFSDQLVFKLDTGGSTYTGIIQYKIINASPNTMTDTTGSDSSVWDLAYALYKSS